jgi:hypothetical protein
MFSREVKRQNKDGPRMSYLQLVHNEWDAAAAMTRRELQRLHAVTFTAPDGTFRQTAQPTKPQIDIYAQLGLPLPRKIIEITPAGR